jgi:hypothetical protein
MIATNLGQESGSGQAEKLGRLPTIPSGMPQHGGNLPPLDSLQWLGRRGGFAQGLPQSLEIQFRQAQVEDQEPGTLTGCPPGHRSQRGRSGWTVGLGCYRGSRLPERLGQLLGAAPVVTEYQDGSRVEHGRHMASPWGAGILSRRFCVETP